MPFGHRRREARDVGCDFKELVLRGYRYDMQKNTCTVTRINIDRPIYPNTLDYDLDDIRMFQYRYIIVDVQKCWQNSNALCQVDGYEKGRKWINIGRFESYVHFFQRSTEELMNKAFGRKMGCRTSLFNLESNNFRASIINGNIKIIVNTVTKKRYFIFRFWTQKENTNGNTNKNTFEPLFCICEQNDRYSTESQQQQQYQQYQQNDYNYENNYRQQYPRNCGNRGGNGQRKQKNANYQYWQCKKIATTSEVGNFFREQCKAISQFATTISDEVVEEYFLPARNEIVIKEFHAKLPFDYSLKPHKCGDCQTRLHKLLNDIRASLGDNGYSHNQVKLNRYLKDKLWEIMRYERIDVNYLMQLLYEGINRAKEMAQKYPQLVRTQVYIDDIYGRIHHELLLLVEIIGPNGNVHPLALAMIEDKMENDGAKNCDCSTYYGNFNNSNYNYNGYNNNGYGCNYGNNNYNNYNNYSNNNWNNGYMNNSSNNNSNYGNYGGELEKRAREREEVGDAVFDENTRIYRYDGRALLTPRMASANASLNSDYLWYHSYVYEHNTTYFGSFVEYMVNVDPNVDLASLWPFDICQKYQYRESFYQVFETQLQIQQQIQEDVAQRKQRHVESQECSNNVVVINQNNMSRKQSGRKPPIVSHRYDNSSSRVNRARKSSKSAKGNRSSVSRVPPLRTSDANKTKTDKVTQKSRKERTPFMGRISEAKSINDILAPTKKKVSEIYKEGELNEIKARQLGLALYEAYKSQAETSLSFSLELAKTDTEKQLAKEKKENENESASQGDDDICDMISFKSGSPVNDKDKINGFWSLYMALFDQFKDEKNSIVIDAFKKELEEMAKQTKKISDLERQISAKSLKVKWQKSKKLVEIPATSGNNGSDKKGNGISDDIVKKATAANKTEQTNQQPVLQAQWNIRYGTNNFGLSNVVQVQYIAQV